MSPRGLLILPRPGAHYREDFRGIARFIRSIDPELQVKVVHEAEPARGLADGLEGLPSLTVSFRHGVPSAAPGRVLSCRYIPKPQQLRAYAAAGVAFPIARMFRWGLELDPARWGPFVVIKPIAPGTMSHGAAHLMPTRLIPRLAPKHFAPEHPVHSGPMLVQAFVDTGKRPSHHRVLTLFGEPLYAMEIVLKQERPPLTAPLTELLGAAIASNGGPRDRIMVKDPEVLAFARYMARALPSVPLQALDIVREEQTGRLFALESNPGGNTWHFSSRLCADMREEMGDGRRLLLTQFDALKRAAEALVRATHAYAALSPSVGHDVVHQTWSAAR
jgi:hypothetical protein